MNRILQMLDELALYGEGRATLSVTRVLDAIDFKASITIGGQKLEKTVAVSRYDVEQARIDIAEEGCAESIQELLNRVRDGVRP